MSDDLEPLSPREGVETWLDHIRFRPRRLNSPELRHRLAPFVKWCARDDIDNLNDLSSRDIFRYEAARWGEDVKDSAPDEGVRTEFESRLGSCLLAAADVV